MGWTNFIANCQQQLKIKKHHVKEVSKCLAAIGTHFTLGNNESVFPSIEEGICRKQKVGILFSQPSSKMSNKLHLN